MAVKTKANKDAADAYIGWCNDNKFPFDFDLNQIEETNWDIKLYKPRLEETTVVKYKVVEGTSN